MTTQPSVRPLAIGDALPPFNLPGVDGISYLSDSFGERPLLTVIFLANHCPYVGSWEDRMVAIATEYSDRVAFVGVCSSDATQFPQDAPEAMRTRVEDAGYPFPYLYDADQSAARSFGATRTPEVFVFDKDRVLRYHGAIDNDWEEDAATEHHLRKALDCLSSGVEVVQPETPAVGCTIKYRG